MFHLLLVLFLIGPPFISAVPDSCLSPEMQNEARNCVNELTPMYDNLRRALAGTWKSRNITKDINDFCGKAVKCFKNLQVCAGIDTNLVYNIDGVCDLYRFKSGKFDGCYQKLSDNYGDCVYSFFMSPVYVDAPTNRQRCQNLKSNGKCVKGKIQSKCSKDYANDFDDELDGQIKRFDCK